MTPQRRRPRTWVTWLAWVAFALLVVMQACTTVTEPCVEVWKGQQLRSGCTYIVQAVIEDTP